MRSRIGSRRCCRRERVMAATVETRLVYSVSLDK
jgi:hypothetical protein